MVSHEGGEAFTDDVGWKKEIRLSVKLSEFVLNCSLHK